MKRLAAVAESETEGRGDLSKFAVKPVLGGGGMRVRKGFGGGIGE